MNNPVLRLIVASVLGVIVAGVVVGVVEFAGHAAFPPPDGLDLTNPADQARLMEVIPFEAKIAVVAAWFLGSLAGCYVAARLGKSVAAGWIVAGVMVALSVITTQMFPHPVWMIVAAVALPVIAKIMADRLPGASSG